MAPPSENAILLAIKEVENGISQRLAAKRHGIATSTLRHRLNGGQSPRKAKEGMQRLSKEQEEHLVEWILLQESLGLAVTHQQMRELAERIAKAGGDNKPLGKRWVEHFIKRNPEVRTKRGKPMDSKRVNGVTINILNDFFQFFLLPLIQSIPPEHRYNMDETGILEGRGSNGLVLGSAETNSVIIKQPGSRYWTTIAVCISAAGRALSPLVIFKGLKVQNQWFPDEVDFLAGWAFEASEKGWTSDAIALKWLQEIFIPQTKPKTPQRRLLIVDGHGSHTTDEFLYECHQNDIYLLFLPPHTSHVLQPLDISVFSPIKTYYRQALAKYHNLEDSTPYGKITFLRCYHEARKLGMTERNIRAGWRGSGLWPVNIQKPLASPFLLPDKRSEKKPRTPSPKRELLPITFSTPTRSQQIRTIINSIEITDPATRLLLRKVGSQLDRQNIKIAEAEAKIQVLQQQIATLKPKKKQKVDENPNSRFIRIKEIIETRERLAKQLQPQAASKSIAAVSFQDLCHEWQLE